MKCWNPRCSNDTLATDAIVCPECNTDRPRRHGAGEAAPERRKTIVIHGHEISVKLCAYVERGEACAEIARFSQRTDGGGPFWCDQHFPPFRGVETAKRDRTAEQARTIASYLPKPRAPDREPGEDG